MLELARARADLEGVVCVHGDLTPTGDDGKNVGAAVLAIVGADDPKVPAAQVAAFEGEMRARAGWTGRSSATAGSPATSRTRRPGGT